MVGQAPGDPGENPSALTNDPIFSNVHNAFQLGWSIIELKSRIQIAALSSSITGTPQAKSTPRPTNSSQGQASPILQNVLSTVKDAKTKLLLPESQQNLTELPNSAWLTSLWRATFNRIAESHKGCFPESTTTGTLYNLPPSTNNPSYQALIANPQTYDASNMYLPYLYLNPLLDTPDKKNYSDVGVQLDTEIPADFTLYDVTRRTLNCLTLLYTNPEESLTPVTVSDYQMQLMQNVMNFSQLDATINNTKQSGQPEGDPTTLNQPVAAQGDGAPTIQISTGSDTGDTDEHDIEDQKNEAIQIVSNNAIRFLETWDTYARETLYVSGGEVAQANEIQLVAYEAGRAMASLSWGITTTIVPIENALNHTMNTDPSTSQDAKNDPALQQHLEKAWLKIFDERSIASIQQQISALSTAMDDAYYRIHPNIPRPNPNDPAERTNLALPSQTIQAITFSLDYWKRAVQLICNGQPDTNAGTPLPGGVSKPVTIPNMTQQVSSQLRLALVQQAEIWQPLLLHQQSLLDFTTQYVTQRILNDFMGSIEMATAKEIEADIRRYRIPLIIVGGVMLLLLASAILFITLSPGSLAAVITLVVGGIAGFYGNVAKEVSSLFSPSPSSANVEQRSARTVSGITGLAGAALVEAFQNGYKQILIEFDYLNHNVSITYPLVEYFILHSNQLAMRKANNAQATTPAEKSTSQSLASEVTIEAVDLIKDAYDFLTQIAWTNQERADEIGRIVRAAFGPIGAFVGAQISLFTSQEYKSSTSKK